jgi:UDP-N-acetylmuramoylalanine--D-glutamate ligase
MQIALADKKSEMKLHWFQDKNITVVGLARSGIGAANLLSLSGARVYVTDISPRYRLEENIKMLAPSVTVSAGGHQDYIFDSADLIVVSPGVPLNIPPLVRARSRGVPVIGELELAYQMVKSELITPHFIGITGTNGKSTTATLISLMLDQSGFRTLLGGNIGNALTEEVYKLMKGSGNQVYGDTETHPPHPPVSVSPFPDFIVAEISSFQLESIRDFRPFIALILNITPDHLDRYSGMQEYIEAKARIFENQKHPDSLILNADDPVVMDLYDKRIRKSDPESRGLRVLFFSREREVEGIYHKDGHLHFNSLSTSKTAPSAFLRKQDEGAVFPPLRDIPVQEVRIEGVHNMENAMAASLAAVAAGCPAEAVLTVLGDFSGLEHRTESVCEINGVRFINDSKGTNTGATLRSLEGLHNVVLIMGGRDKGGDFSVLKNLIGKKVKSLVLFGEAKEKIASQLYGIVDITLAGSLEETVRVSLAKASPGDIVLFSPGCASFDMFSDFEERGRRFKEAVRKIQEETINNDRDRI